MSNTDANATTRPTCKRPRCKSPARTKGLCSKHYDHDRKMRAATGARIPGIVDKAALVEHVAALRAKGLGLRRISELSGVDGDSLRNSLNRYARVYADTVARVLAVPIPATPLAEALGGARLSPIGTARRLQALIALGHSQRDIAERLGILETNLSGLVNARQQQVSAATARRVAKVYDELSTVRGKSGRSVTRAAKNGWAPPLAWDEDTIDDPNAAPADATVTPITRAGSRAVDPDFLDIVEDWRSLGRSDADIAERFGIKLDTFYTRLRRLQHKAS